MTETPKPNPFTDVNPYTPSPTAMLAARRPNGLTAICIIAIVLGVLGTLSGFGKGINVAFGAQMQQAFGSLGAGAGNSDMQKAQQEMNNALAEEMVRFRLANGILCITQTVLCVGLAYAAIKTLGFNANSRKLLLWLCCFLLVYEVGQFVVFAYQQLSMAPIMEEYMPRMMKGPNGEDVGGEDFGKIIARVSVIVGMISQSFWTLLKFAFYGVAVYYLRKSNVIALFDSPLSTGDGNFPASDNPTSGDPTPSVT